MSNPYRAVADPPDASPPDYQPGSVPGTVIVPEPPPITPVPEPLPAPPPPDLDPTDPGMPSTPIDHEAVPQPG